ncbi:hypothetical protein [Tortoise microvirus 80]|nr:hypothetical protein [Tortoise microvirus 80]
MKRFENAGTILNPAPIVDWDLNGVRDEWDESVTDKSYFVPLAESVKTINSTPLSEAEIAANYDFADGRDTGQKIPVDRYRGLDLAEVSKIERELRSKIEKQAKQDKENAERKKLYDEVSKPLEVATPTPAPAPAK